MKRNETCKRCALSRECRTICLWGEGSLKSPLMIVGEAPGKDEDVEGRPFIGRPGRLLDHCLRYLSLPREELYLTNAVKCRPGDKGLPKRKEDRQAVIDACQSYFDEEFQSLKPKVVLALGATALQILTEGKTTDISEWQGRKVGFFRTAQLFAGYHPSFVLHKPSFERYLTAGIKAAAEAAGFKTEWNKDEPLYDYESFR